MKVFFFANRSIFVPCLVIVWLCVRCARFAYKELRLLEFIFHRAFDTADTYRGNLLLFMPWSKYDNLLIRFFYCLAKAWLKFFFQRISSKIYYLRKSSFDGLVSVVSSFAFGRSSCHACVLLRDLCRM